jgi:hypothetical protein
MAGRLDLRDRRDRPGQSDLDSIAQLGLRFEKNPPARVRGNAFQLKAKVGRADRQRNRALAGRAKSVRSRRGVAQNTIMLVCSIICSPTDSAVLLSALLRPSQFQAPRHKPKAANPPNFTPLLQWNSLALTVYTPEGTGPWSASSHPPRCFVGGSPTTGPDMVNCSRELAAHRLYRFFH